MTRHALRIGAAAGLLTFALAGTATADEEALQAVRAIRGPLLGVWQQVSSNYLPCPDCMARVITGVDVFGAVATDTCIGAMPKFDASDTSLSGEPVSGLVLPGEGLDAGGTFGMALVGGELRITVDTDGVDAALGTYRALNTPIVETYRRVRGPESFTQDDLEAFRLILGFAPCRHPPTGAQLAIFEGMEGMAQQAATQAVPQQQTAPAPQQAAPAATGTSGEEAAVLAVSAAVIGAGVYALADAIGDAYFTEAATPVAPGSGQGRIVTVRIMAVEAIETTFGFGGDEIFLLASNGARLPQGPDDSVDIDSGETWQPNWQVSSSGGLSFDLREWDSFNASDVIGNFAVDAAHPPGRFQTTLTGDSAEYRVTYDVQ